jgi:CDP-diacylglycerol--serine O-phosphatidyltransferase
VLAAVLDAMDGRLARLLKSESEIGAELDSLVDFVNFGVAPGIILYLWALHTVPEAGWIAALVYIVCCLLRLARFNIMNRAPDGDSSHFTGVPSPAGAMLAFMPLYFTLMLQDTVTLPAMLVALWMVGVGGLMIGRFPTPSFKTATVFADQVRYVVVGFVALAAALLTYPWETLFALNVVYGVVLVVTWLRRRRSSTGDGESDS